MIRLGRSAETRQIMLFLLAGAANTAFGYGLFGMLLWAHLAPSLAVILATLGGILFNFGTLGKVFASHAAYRLPRFVAVYAVQILLNLLLISAFMSIGFPPLAAQAGAMTLLIPFSFVAMRRVVFASSVLPGTSA